MSGHSKWNNIKRKKEKTDGARAKVFTKIGREISVAVRNGGPDPASNGKLADLISKAKRGHQLRGLRPRRRGRHGRDPDRQPQPHRRRPAPLL